MLLSRFYLYNDFSEFEDLVLKHCDYHKTFSKGAILHDATSSYKTSYYIKKGIAKLCVLNEAGAENTLLFFGEGAIHPINCMQKNFLLEDSLALVAVTDLEVIAFRSPGILEMTAEDNRLTAAIIEMFDKYCNMLEARVVMYANNDSVATVSVFLYLYARYKPNGDNIVDLTQEEIGNLVGISRMQVSRALKPLRDAGIIETHNCFIRILNEKGLRSFGSKSVVGDETENWA